MRDDKSICMSLTIGAVKNVNFDFDFLPASLSSISLLKTYEYMTDSVVHKVLYTQLQDEFSAGDGIWNERSRRNSCNAHKFSLTN